MLNQQGQKVGYFRPITVRPFPGTALRQAVVPTPTSVFWSLNRPTAVTVDGQSGALWAHKSIDTLLKPGLGLQPKRSCDRDRRAPKEVCHGG